MKQARSRRFLVCLGLTLALPVLARASIEVAIDDDGVEPQPAEAKQSQDVVDDEVRIPDPLASDPIGVPMRIRDFTFPSHLVLAFAPMPAAPLGRGNWALEAHFSQVNNFQVSPEVEEYLASTRAEGERRPLDTADIDAILAQPAGSAFYIDGEFSFWDFNAFYGVTERLDLAIGWYYIGYSGGELDGSIFDFHDEFGFGQQGRQYVTDDQFQVVLGVGADAGGQPLVVTERPTSGGFSDPVVSFRYGFPKRSSGWQFALSGGIKIPIADEATFLSSGGFDFGLQLTADRRWTRDAFIFNFDYVIPGDFEQAQFDPPNLPTLHLTWLHAFRRWESTRIMLQMLMAEHPFRDITDSELTKGEFQLTLAMKWDTRLGVFGLGLTENLFNMDNTPDIGLHFSWGYLGRRSTP
ncbi:MAG: DUF3187 family protein [Thermoanaerobaculia bacterium]|nr:DUF3187 family protein [Thermoanaerobaculia bacterium]